LTEGFFENNFDIRDFFNNIIAGTLWLVLLCQFDTLYFGGTLIPWHLNILGGGSFLWPLIIIVVFLLGLFLRSLEFIPKKIFELCFGDPIDYVLKKNESKDIRIRILRFPRGKRMCLHEKIRDEVDWFLKWKIGKELKLDYNKLIYIEYFNSNTNQTHIYDRIKNHKNLMESIMLPEILNAGFILWQWTNKMTFLCSDKGNIALFVILMLLNLWVVFNRYDYYKTEYCRQVFRSVLELKTREVDLCATLKKKKIQIKRKKNY
jgi:hypothetical protein